MGYELIEKGKSAAVQGNYPLLRSQIFSYLSPCVREIAGKEDLLVINVGYLVYEKALTVNLRTEKGVRYFQIKENGYIQEGEPK